MQRLAGDHGARRAERAGVVTGASVSDWRIDDPVGGGAQGGGDDLGVHGGGAVAELGRADRRAV